MAFDNLTGTIFNELYKKVPNLFNPVTSLIGRVYKFCTAAANGNSARGSLTELSKAARVEPFTIISDDLMVGQEYMHDVLDTVLSVFSAYYLQAIALDTEINGIKVAGYLDQFSPSRSGSSGDVLNNALTAAADTAVQLGWVDSSFGSVSSESFQKQVHPSELEIDPPYLNIKNYYFSLPFRSNKITLEQANNVSLEATFNPQLEDDIDVQIAAKEKELEDAITNLRRGNQQDRERIQTLRDERESLFKAGEEILSTRSKAELQALSNSQQHANKMAQIAAQAEASLMNERDKIRMQNTYAQSTINDKSLAEIKESSNQVIGKVFNVNIVLDGYKFTTPVTVRLIAVPAKVERIASIMAGKKLEDDFGSRWKRWRAGRIEFFRDLILCQDLIDEHRRRLMEDDGGVLMAIEKRKSGQTKAQLSTNTVSMADATNIFIISKDVEKKIEGKIGGKLSSPMVRNKIFAQTYAMIIVVIDKAYERVVIYTRGVSMPSTFGFRELKNKVGKSNDAGVMELLKSLQTSNPLSF